MRKNQITNDLLAKIMQSTYLFDWVKINILISELYYRYLNILDFVNMLTTKDLGHEELNLCFIKVEEARVYLYFLGYFFTEQFGPGAIERRLPAYDIKPLDFYNLIDQFKIPELLSDISENDVKNFMEIVNFYLVLKYWKQKTTAPYKLYFAEDYFNKTKKKVLFLIENDSF
ncbi:hypothetical protein AUK11_04350 [bacterium CG2_30_37_16]|nr:MAG: hypothetical protein AUK11_04350 [bacterium CG2_30_37_16]PIP30621.1 MAG: hypothetical protein COX25_03735 [bacterium (Candidatus Howlettbacteria) CG23_combo_of_CG06-09_8_20_14_all_37_9]PJB06250.1 MAG: hypothetical protein CO123_02470 [bacterium (Candidatus Howlettbacteria) CG_4_9_14_3_um_filter_37_10]